MNKEIISVTLQEDTHCELFAKCVQVDQLAWADVTDYYNCSEDHYFNFAKLLMLFKKYGEEITRKLFKEIEGKDQHKFTMHGLEVRYIKV